MSEVSLGRWAAPSGVWGRWAVLTASAYSAHRYSCEWGGVAAGRPYVAGLEEFGQLVLQDVWHQIQKLYIQVSEVLMIGSMGRGQAAGQGGWEAAWWELGEAEVWGAPGGVRE